MSKKCIYCKKELSENSVVDFCDECGTRVWGEKMFETIKKNMEDAREKGDLYPVKDFSYDFKGNF